MSILRFKRSSALSVTMLVLLALVVPLAGPAAANHGQRTLEIGNCTGDQTTNTTCSGSNQQIIANEVDSNKVRDVHRIRAVLRNDSLTAPADSAADSASGPINIDFEIESGPGDNGTLPNGQTVASVGGGAGNTPNSPDLTCTVPVGASFCEVEYTTSETGTDVIRGWIDHDNNNDTTKTGDAANETYDATEGRISNNTTDCGSATPDPNGECVGTPVPGEMEEPDGTDVIQKNWTAGDPAVLDCNPEEARNPSTGAGSSETYTCRVTDNQGNAKSGIPIDGENLNGANDPDNSASGAPNGTECGTTEQPRDCADYDHENPNETSGDRHFCVTGADGSCSDTVDAIDAESGSANICFWTDSENTDSDAALEGDGVFDPAGAEEDGGDCDLETTGQNDSDLTDTVTKTWETRSASSGGVDAEPETDTNNPGETHRITATVYDQFGSPFSSSTVVKFEFFEGSPADTDGNTPQSPDKQCTTNNSSSCFIEYTSEKNGTDLVCVFTNANPVMSGNNTNGTCDGEGLNDADDTAGDPDSPEPGNDDQDVVQKQWGPTGTASRLDCSPETDSNPTGTSHTITCSAVDNDNAAVGGVNVDAEATGANDPDNGDSPQSPDFNCTTNAQGQCSFTHGPGGNGTTGSTGETTYRAWIDSDNNNLTTESDRTEGQNETTQAGTATEPDNTDVVTKTWTAGGRRIDCEPETDSNPTGTNHVVTCTVTDGSNRAVQGESVTFTESGAGQISGSSTATTDANGRATVTTTSSEAGEQTITGTITNDTTGAEPTEVDECDRPANDPSGAPAGECSDTVTKTWTQAAAQCADGTDNDGDGQTDHPDDPGCDSPQDNDETDPEPTVENGPCAGYQHNSSQPRPGGNGLVVVGSPGPDNLVGSEGDDLICALGGRDSLRGLSGDDVLVGGGGHDNIRGTEGNDSMYGGRGLDVMRGGSGSDLARGQGQDDAIRGYTGNDRLIGGNGNDTIRAGGGRDKLVGNAGDDILDGGGGRDRCRGGRGKDILSSC